MLDFTHTYTQILDDDARIIAHQVARGSYQRALLEGSASWSGAGLRGAAGRYGTRYAQSRGSLLARLRAAGLHVIAFPLKSGKICVAIASERFALSVTYTTEGETIEARIEEEALALIPSARRPASRKAGAHLHLVA